MHLNKNHTISRRALAMLLTLTLCFSLVPSAFAAQQNSYLSMFRERTPEWAQDGPKLVFICAPLRGDVEKNIEFARQKAQEVFADGDIPICPHLLFPPITDPKHPEQDKKVKEMSLRLLESCQQLNVYGPIWTDDMWKHIYRAGDLGIPVMTDQKAIGRTPPRRSGRKER